ncbi:DNA repair protein RadC [Halosquirtibacter laminarini]|uniref:DNA repair protein RadC n=1 Tax=Halosquirtibacter laminarini TaxID=3374600 RepID=A0AC61NMI4_9BACT|nr:DNA repair protein RadC [Prolixibacteraceae bacterium]
MSNKSNYTYSIKDLALEDRPREKYKLKGAKALSDSELVAILLRSGNTSETAIELAQRILKYYNNNLITLSKSSVKELESFRGVGETKAVTLKAAFELGKRRHIRNSDLVTIHNSEDVNKAIRFELQDLKHEEFWILLLDHQNHILKKHRSSKGGLTSTTVDLRPIIKEAVINSATQMIIAHNHPSGSLSPSQEDIVVTKKINTGLELIDIKLLDHLIITNDSYYSMADHGLI